MTSALPTSRPHLVYLDTCVPSAIVKGELSPADTQALMRIGEMAATGAIVLCTSTMMLEEMRAIPDAYRAAHLEAYNCLRTVVGHPTTRWLDNRSTALTYGQETIHPAYAALRDLLPDENDARHLFQAAMNDVQDFVTLDARTLVSRGPAITRLIGVSVATPSQYVASVEHRST